ncbi:hypothetical protein D0Z07_4632 [Hyphodiscus hymeniophilus]|uniref:Uncharacterized protein n=1 Tax=Hyphodiscus hymeniophilus TaxID=353542 RepID=A0A9P7AX06_9HELO|nr:hypothetical protein D0Z07_4632 [Hyphodiscus hymeniophilus]
MLHVGLLKGVAVVLKAMRVNSYLCPASVGYGCCLDGFACAVNGCYATSISTFVFTETVTTTDAENLPHKITSTITTASSPTLPTDVASNTAPIGVIAKVTPTQTAIPKTNPTSSSSSIGLTKGQLGGIIGGAVALLAVLILATFFMFRRLNKVVAALTASQSRTRTSSNKPSRKARPSDSDMDTLSIDPLMMNPSEASRSVRFPSHPSLVYGPAHEVDGSSSSPPVSDSPFSPQSLRFNHYSRGYNPVPTSESNSSPGYGRNPSVESTPPLGHPPNAGYFDISPNLDLRDQNLRFGHSSPPLRRPSQHHRNRSETSNQSGVSTGSSSVAELGVGDDSDRRSSFQRVLRGFGMGRMSPRKKSSGTDSSPVTLTGRPASRRPQWAPGPDTGPGSLGHISEAGESRITVHDTGQEMREISLVDPMHARGVYELWY